MKENDLAVSIGVGRSTLSDIEVGKHAPSVYIAMRISKILKCRIEDLFSESDDWLKK